jgi:predicted transcriptional regulator
MTELNCETDMKKIRLTVYLSRDVHDKLKVYAGSRQQPLSIMAEAGIAAFVDTDQRDATVVRRLASMERKLERLHRDSNISIEGFMVFVWMWLSANPPLAEHIAASARASATERYDQFMETLGQRLAGKNTFLSDHDDRL